MPTTAAEHIGSAIKSARREYNLTQQQLADLAGFSDKTIRDIEKGTGSPSLHAVISALDVVGLTLEVID